MLMIRGIIRSLAQTGFFAVILFIFAGTFLLRLPLWLESSAGVLVLPLVFAPVVARIFVEERTLRGILPGYVEYMNEVRFRLVPCVW